MSEEKNTQMCIRSLGMGSYKSPRQAGLARYNKWYEWTKGDSGSPESVLPELFRVEPYMLERYPQLTND